VRDRRGKVEFHPRPSRQPLCGFLRNAGNSDSLRRAKPVSKGSDRSTHFNFREGFWSSSTYVNNTNNAWNVNFNNGNVNNNNKTNNNNARCVREGTWRKYNR